jgi:hypothetical protein
MLYLLQYITNPKLNDLALGIFMCKGMIWTPKKEIN